jgi:cell division protein ZapE
MRKKFSRPFNRILKDPPAQRAGLLEKKYKEQVLKNHIQYDEAQFLALQSLQKLLDILLSTIEYERKSIVHKLLSAPPPAHRSLYIFGDVGCGKSMLMNLFYEVCPIARKRRVHFNTFMLEVHAFIHQCRQRSTPTTDALSVLAKKIRDSVLLLCFDEFHVTDIADAMILGRLFGKLFESGIIIVITSNRHPNDLYQGGLQREQFLFFIKVLHKASDILELTAKKDYRLNCLSTADITYYFPLDVHAQQFARQHYDKLTHFAVLQPGTLQILGRRILLTAVHKETAFSSFEELCAQPLGPADYLEIANRFSTLIMTDIPRLSAEKRNEAKRFVTLIDALYEHKVKLICTAEAPAQALYIQGHGAFEFRRTVSRLIEMQSESYLQSEHVR